MSIFRKSDYTAKKDTSATKGHWSKKTGIRRPTQLRTHLIYCRNCNSKNKQWSKICSQCGCSKFQKNSRK